MTTFKPLLAAAADFKLLNFNRVVWLSAKLDGIRAIVKDGVVLSRSLKPIPNKHVQALFGVPALNGYDEELIVGEPHSPTCYRDTNSGVMSVEGEPKVTFYVFDRWDMPELEYADRYRLVESIGPRVEIVPQHPVDGIRDVAALEEQHLALGYEGVMLRYSTGLGSYYKYGRSTAREGTLLKVKRFTDAEAVVIGVEEEMANMNEATTNALGRTERSSHAENKVGKGRLGALICQTPEGITFRIGTGFDAADRESLWGAALEGRFVKYKHFDVGAKTAPRFPVFLGWRDPVDM